MSRSKISCCRVTLEQISPSAGSRTSGAGPTRSCKILTLAELFQGKKPDIPFVDPSSIKRAKREDEDARKQGSLL
jgi:hypothetical protein